MRRVSGALGCCVAVYSARRAAGEECANVGAVAAAGGKQFARFFGALGFDAPLLDARDMDCRVGPPGW